MPQLQRPVVMMWALMQFNWILEQSGLFFDDATAMRAYHHGLLYCQLHVLAAFDALQECRPRWKVRPRLHSLVCEVLCKLGNGSRLNPKFLACWSDEDYIGQSCAIGKSRCIHPSTLGLRLLQRLVLVLNAELAAPSKNDRETLRLSQALNPNPKPLNKQQPQTLNPEPQTPKQNSALLLCSM